MQFCNSAIFLSLDWLRLCNLPQFFLSPAVVDPLALNLACQPAPSRSTLRKSLTPTLAAEQSLCPSHRATPPDEMGLGKTVEVLALILASLEGSSPWVDGARADDAPSSPAPGVIRSPAPGVNGNFVWAKRESGDAAQVGAGGVEGHGGALGGRGETVKDGTKSAHPTAIEATSGRLPGWGRDGCDPGPRPHRRRQ
jgi:hypothetical protein